LQKYQVGGNWEKILCGWDGFNEPESRFRKQESFLLKHPVNY